MAFDRHEPHLGEAFAEMLRDRFGNTPNPVARETDLDPRVARNAIEGKAGVPAISQTLLTRKRVADDHFDLWLRLGEALFGETLEQYEERQLRRIIESTENAKRLAEERRERRASLDQRAAASLAAWDRPETGGCRRAS